MRFKHFIINEVKSHLGEKLGDILAALQNLSEDAPNMGTKQLVDSTKGIVDNIRPILKDNWPDTEKSSLEALQRVGVALSNAIESNEDLKSTLATAVQDLQQSSEKLGEPVNTIGATTEGPAPE